MLARSILESPEGKLSSKSSRGFFTSSLGEKDNEFSREMFMFPLSIKNPAVSLMASRFVLVSLVIHLLIYLLVIFSVLLFVLLSICS